MRTLASLAIALSLGTVSSAALADSGNAFVNANAGASHYNVSNPFSGVANNHFSNTGKAGALRAGYRWNSVVDYGVEAGYGFLGNANACASADGVGAGRVQVKTRGWLLGGNLNYNISEHWYLDARGGWFRARTLMESRFLGTSPANYKMGASAVAVGTGEYFGVGGGYNVNQHFSVGLAYDTYRAPVSKGGGDRSMFEGSNRIGMYSLQAEYRF
ncbi:hypothetical protein DWU98_01145 [Dyella monticola]|uniref:Outer membrane protein OmpA-like transmembrane domain-containing protein n=1 Tax=Dyella monticola TaxID=1927958 RepID=A0A370X8P9_9GAMM|nr:hypothetical protein [Dyella monticola]RDS84605.1 hypothetical protein DWU98_01145 [Dyella monticola]